MWHGAGEQFYQQVFGWRFEDYGPDYTSFQDGRLSGGFTKDAPVRPANAFPGGRRFHFSDPSGNELAVWTDR